MRDLGALQNPNVSVFKEQLSSVYLTSVTAISKAL